MKCRHGKPHYEHCDQCSAEYKHLEQYRARIKQYRARIKQYRARIKLTNDALVANARALIRRVM